MATGIQKDLEKQYVIQVRCMWIWLRVTGNVENLQSFKNHAENYIDKIKYCEYQFELKAKELFMLGILHWKNRTTPNSTDKFFSQLHLPMGKLIKIRGCTGHEKILLHRKKMFYPRRKGSNWKGYWQSTL